MVTPSPKRVKRGHLSSDYRQKCVNATLDILMSKARKMTILPIIMFKENVHEGAFLAVQNSSIGDLVPWLLALSGATNNQSLRSTTDLS